MATKTRGRRRTELEIIRKRWWRFVDEVCAERVSGARLQDLLDFLFHDAEDIPEQSLFGFKHSRRSSSAILTPVEALLLFTRISLSRLQASLAEVRQIPEFRLTYPQHYARHKNLVHLLALARRQAETGPFSDVDRLLLYAQWSGLRHTWTQLHADPITRAQGRRVSKLQLDRIEERVKALALSNPDVESVRALCLYRRALHAARVDDRVRAARYIREFFLLPRQYVPRGLYFHATRELYRLPADERRAVLRACRMSLAATFALLPEGRALDRIGICYALGADAAMMGAPLIAARTTTAADLIVTSVPELSTQDHVRRHLRWLRARLQGQIGAELDVDETLDENVRQLIDEVGAVVERDAKEAYERLSTPDEADVPLYRALYGMVTRTWLARLSESDVPEVTSDAFLAGVDTAIEEYRNVPSMLAVVRAGCVCRLLRAQGQDLIDQSFEEFERLVAVIVLAGDWQALVDQLASGRHRFLAKMGFEGESAKLASLAGYFEQLFGLVRTPEEIRNSERPVDRLLFGSHVPTTSLRHAMDRIENRWRNDAKAGAEDVTISQWSASYAAARRRPSFAPDASDPLVRDFFDDCHTLLQAELDLPQFDHIDQGTILASMGWAALHIARVLRKVQFETPQEKVRTEGGTDRDWVARGIRWMDTAIDIASARERSAALYRALDGRKRLEEYASKRANAALIEKLAGQMLEIDERRLDTTRLASRRSRAIIRAERTLGQVIGKDWCRQFQTPVTLNSSMVLSDRFRLVQRLKTFNYGVLNQARDDGREGSPYDAMANQTVEYLTPDVLDRQPPDAVDRIRPHSLRGLYRHLKSHQAAILDFFTHPGSGGSKWEEEAERRWGTICFVVTAGQHDIEVRPFYLDVPEALIRLVVDGQADLNDAGSSGLATDLVYWPDNRGVREPPPPKLLRELSKRLFPEELLRAIAAYPRLYLCPHRHLFQVPLHAFPINLPLFARGFDVSYAFKTLHVAGLLKAGGEENAARTRRWTLVDASALGEHARGIGPWIAESDNWRQAMSTERLIAAGTSARQAIVCCHGQLDETRPGRSRLRLWAGGRLIADDFHRMATSSDSSRAQALDYAGSHWIFAACDAGRARVGIRTAPGMALTVANCGASRVTSCLYRVLPHVAASFLDKYLSAWDGDDASPFTAAVRGLYDVGSTDGSAAASWRARWAQAAAFTSYGIFPRI